ncbi:MAG: hypothetical protein DI605_06310 [Sphingomonas sp.]|nr:MAG: hypothetical protein DI605_06310 [Sphingomonas sp.]
MSGAGGSWKLAAPHAARAQGLVVSGFGKLPTGRALFLEFRWQDQAPGKGSWLGTLDAIAPVTDASGRQERAVSLAFTHAGLARMGLPAAALDSFAAPFREGMMQEDRLRRLGDRREGEWLGTVIPDGPKWSANTPRRGAMQSAPDAPVNELTATGHREERIVTEITVHALLQLFEKDEDSAEAWATAVEAALAPHGIAVVRKLPLDLRPDAKGIDREHFGFADGVSQPIPFDETAIVGAAERDYWNGIPLGDVLLGHRDSHHEIAPSPSAPPLAPGAPDPELAPHPLAEGMLDFGLDGSYMVVRELKQDVAAFWNSLDAAAERIRLRDPHHSAHVTADWIAERVIGRTRDGELLCPAGSLLPDAGNAFGFFDRDRHGYGCPVGSHVRRSNPRDGLAPDAGSRDALLEAANAHRFLRRGRKYGTTIADRHVDDHADRGLLFICLNTDIGRQFEFVQQTWLLNSNFATLYDEMDPLLGAKGHMTIREKPLRRRIAVDTFVQMAGGDYFFLPSIPALRYLGSL